MRYTRIPMLKRFARFIPVIAAAVAVAVALVVLSRVMVTVDTIAQPEYRYAYLGGVVVLLGGLGVFAWLKLRRPPTASSTRQVPHQRRLSPEARLDKLYARHRLDQAEPVSARAHLGISTTRDPGRAVVAIAGVRGAGKSALAAALRDMASTGGRDALAVDLVELTGLGTNLGHNIERLAPAQAADLTLFVVDQDLRDYEQDAIDALARRQANLLIVLNKCDLMRPQARAETVAAIAAKLANAAVEADIVTTAAAPMPAVRLVDGRDGSDRGDDAGEEEVHRPPEVAAIRTHLEALAARRGRSGVRVTSAAG